MINKINWKDLRRQIAQILRPYEGHIHGLNLISSIKLNHPSDGSYRNKLNECFTKLIL